jgi:glucokinase
LGGTKIELGVVDDAGRVHQHRRVYTEVLKGSRAIEDQILGSVYALQQEANVPILGIGIGAAGQIHSETGEVVFAPNLNWHNVPLRADIEKALNLPVQIVNDVRAITLGEWKFGAGRGCRDLLCVFVGTGIGSGVVSHGHLLTGCTNTFGEVGHMTIDFNGPLCTCGKKGCLEVFAGGWGIAARAQEAMTADGKGLASQFLLQLAGGQLNAISAKIVVQAYHEGDEMAKRIIDLAKTALIAGLASLVNAFNPCRLILGGGLIDGMPEIIQEIDESVHHIALKAATQSLKIVKAKLGKEVGVIGSAAAVFQSLSGEN